MAVENWTLHHERSSRGKILKTRAEADDGSVVTFEFTRNSLGKITRTNVRRQMVEEKPVDDTAELPVLVGNSIGKAASFDPKRETLEPRPAKVNDGDYWAQFDRWIRGDLEQRFSTYLNDGERRIWQRQQARQSVEHLMTKAELTEAEKRKLARARQSLRKLAS